MADAKLNATWKKIYANRPPGKAKKDLLAEPRAGVAYSQESVPILRQMARGGREGEMIHVSLC